MAETSKNKIYYNDNENSVADVLADMKKMAESTDEAIEKSKYNDAAIKKSISDVEKKQVEKNTEQDSKIVELQTEKSKLETELKEMQEDFYQNSIRGQASGEYIHVEDSSNCRSIIGISGNSEQETREGYNLLNLTSLIGKTETKNGITYKINEDCSITVNGTPTDYTSFILLNMSLKAGTYKFVDGLNSNNVFLQTLGDFQHTSQNNTFSLAEDGKATVYLVILAGAPTLNNTTLYPMIYEGTEDKPYEQYGAMPSQNCPSEIKTVGSNVNIFDKDNMTIGKIWSGATLLDSDVGNASPKIPVTAGKTYIRNAGYSSNYIIKEDNSVVDIQGGTNAITMPEDSKYWMFNIPKDIDINTIKAEEGSISTPQSKYGQGCVKVTKCNKNLFDKDNITLNEKSYNLDNNGKLIYQGSWRVVNYIKVKPNTTYTLSGVMIPNNWTHRISEYDAQLVHIKQNQKTFDGFHTFTTSSTTKYIRFNLIYDNNGFDYDLSSIQLEENKKKTTLEQHEEKSYIMPTQAEMLENDYFDYDNEEEVHVWNKLILNGTENWEYDSTYNYFRCPSYVFDKIPSTASEDVVKQLSNYFSVVRDWGIFRSNTNLNGFSPISNAGYRLVIRNTNYKTVDTFKTWLKLQYDAGTPVTIYYKQETPTRLAFTDEQKEVAKELNNARTYKNVTNITTDSKAILSLDYAKDLETLLNNTQALAVNNASEGV